MGQEDHLVSFEEGSVSVDEDFVSHRVDKILHTRRQQLVLGRKRVLHRHHEHAGERFQGELERKSRNINIIIVIAVITIILIVIIIITAEVMVIIVIIIIIFSP